MFNRVRGLLDAVITKKGPSILTPVHVGIVLSLSIGFIDVAIDILSGQTDGVALRFIIAPVAVTIALFFLLYMAAWYLVISRIGRFVKLKDMPLAISFAFFIGVLFLLGSIHGLISISPSTAQLSKLFMMFVLSSLFSVLAYFAIGAVSEISGYSKSAVVLGLTLPFLIAEFAMVSKSSLSLLGALTVFIFCALLTVLLFYRLNETIRTRLVIGSFGAILVLAPLSGVTGSGRMPSREGFHLTEHKIKHVILITVDTLRADFVSAFDNRAASTPHIDGLADDGLVFTQTISPAPWTLPSLSSLMTGLSPDVHLTKKPGSKLPDNLQTLAGYMRDNGYFTGAIVFNPYLKLSHGMSQGFLHYDVYPKTVMGNSFGARLLKRLFPRRFRQDTREDITSDVLTNLAIDWLKSNQGKDYFLWVHYLDPHMPYAPPDEFLPKGKAPATIGTKFAGSSGDIRGGFFVPSLSEREWIRKLYGGAVRYADKSVGRLLDALKQLNIYDDSLIILTADHGDEFWEHGSFEHGHSLYNELLHVPLIIKLPLSSSKGRIDHIVPTHSVMPTVLDLCGITYDREHLSTASLSPLWGNNPKTFDERLIVSSALLYNEAREALIFNGLKYTNYLVTNREELYDLNRDPKEQFNIANVSPDLINKARDIMTKYHAQVKGLRDYYQIGKGMEIKLDQKTLQELKSLGYVK